MGMLIGSIHDSQVCGVDYQDTFFQTIVKIIYISVLMALAIENDFDVHHLMSTKWTSNLHLLMIIHTRNEIYM
jgi:hypothetical protein